MPITNLPAAPQPTDNTQQFNAKAFSWVAALDKWTMEANALEQNIESKEASIEVDAMTAATKATEASLSAIAALSSEKAASMSASSASISASQALDYKKQAEYARDQVLAGLGEADNSQLSVLERAKIVTAPETASSLGLKGEIACDLSYLYVCTANNTWKRVAISTW